jgi:anaerobic magnesium-protoporphyrin IX monomethyl ester cyclase
MKTSSTKIRYGISPSRLMSDILLTMPKSELILPYVQKARRLVSSARQKNESLRVFMTSKGKRTASGVDSAGFPKGPVVLVSRDISYTFPLSYGYLAGYLRQQGENVIVLFRADAPALVRQIMSLNPVLVGFGSLYPELQEIRHLIRLLDISGRRFPIVVGGQMVSPTPEFALKVTGADFGVIGEGEIILHQLTCALRSGSDPATVKGLVIRNKDTIINTGFGDYIEDLSRLPPVPYDMFPVEKWLNVGQWHAKNSRSQLFWRFDDRVINVHGGRGCPFTCNFCYHHSKPRYRPIENMMAEATETLERYDGNMLYFSDDLVLASPNRVRLLLDAIRALPRRVEFSVSTRFDILSRIDDALLEEMKDAGCRIMGLGIESGSDRILEIIGKNCTSDEIKTQLERLKKVGILPSVSIMVGQKTETLKDAEASINLMRETVRSNPNIAYAFTITTPFPGSSLYNDIIRDGLIKDDWNFYQRYFSSSSEWNQVINLSSMTDKEVRKMYRKIQIVYQEEKTR